MGRRSSRPRAGLLLLVAVLVSSAAPRGALPATGGCVVVEDFSRAPVGAFPPEWKARTDGGTSVYAVREEGGRRFLAAHAQGLGVQAARPFEWDLRTYPVLAWSWRPREFPPGADERDPATNDSALGVYVVVPHSRVRGPKALKYIWSERVPAGTRLASNEGLTQVRVLRSGAVQRGEWVEERVNARDDYLAAFGTREMPKPAGIAVLTDADATQSSARGDYANFRVCRS